jgi:hypothetical protein
MALQFVAEVVQCTFQEDHGRERVPTIVKRFRKTSGIEPEYLEKTALDIQGFTSYETMLESEGRLFGNPGADSGSDEYRERKWDSRWWSTCLGTPI